MLGCNRSEKVKIDSSQFKEQDFSLEGFNYTHHDFSQILLKIITTHGHDHIINRKLAIENESKLDNYIKSLQTIRFKNFTMWPKIHKKSFLINAYHAFILKKMIDQNFENLTDKVLDEEKTIKVFKRYYSFNAFRNKEIIAKYPFPEIVLSLYCFKKSCPEFIRSAYHSKNIENELSFSIVNYFKHPSKFVLNDESVDFKLSEYLKIYARFFPKSLKAWKSFRNGLIHQ